MEKPLRSIAAFELERELGRGGMGVVWLGRDRRLDRRVAVKMLREGGDAVARERLLREARAAAGINHPHVCQIYEVGEEDGVLFVAMELLEGQSLADRLGSGPFSLDEARPVVCQVLSALDALHQRALVHRDVKPSNIFLTPHGAKLLDFGLVRPRAGIPDDTRLALTQEGSAVGTPRYMAPEQWRGETAGPPADLWAVGVVFYEMLAGRPAFDGTSLKELCDAVLHREPAALYGGPSVVAADRIVQRALEKQPEKRFGSASAMAQAVGAAGASDGKAGPVRARATMRLIVLPFRPLRPDPEVDFLSVSLPDAISGELSSIDSLVVRSRLSAKGGDDVEIREIAREVGVDAVVSGTFLRLGERVRVTAQLVEAPSGTVLWSKNVDGTMEDLFALQDSIVREILASLTVSLTRQEESRIGRAAPASPQAYRLYLRANDGAINWVQESRLLEARDL